MEVRHNGETYRPNILGRCFKYICCSNACLAGTLGVLFYIFIIICALIVVLSPVFTIILVIYLNVIGKCKPFADDNGTSTIHYLNRWLLMSMIISLVEVFSFSVVGCGFLCSNPPSWCTNLHLRLFYTKVEQNVTIETNNTLSNV